MRSLSVVVVVPARNAGRCIAACLDGLRNADFDLSREVVVVDDASMDDTARIVSRLGVDLRSHEAVQGAARARHTGACGQTADIIAFIDADIVVAPDTKTRMLAALRHPDTAAVFGTYDNQPTATGWVSQYRNLLHHYVHTNAAGRATTFWAGIGAVRRSVYEAVGGIDPDIHSMEDVDLGLRISTIGEIIMLDPGITGTHLKNWGWRSMVKTDLFERAIPWAELLVRYELPMAGIKLSYGQRIIALYAAGIGIGLLTAPFHLLGLLLLAVSLVGFTVLSWPFLRWLSDLRGVPFATFSLLPHVVHNWCAGAGIAYVKAKSLIQRYQMQ